jgi:hypothetical protein
MTFIYGTNMELLYSMPAIGATLASTAATCISGTSATNGPFQLPALQNIWSPGNMVGKGLMLVAAGGYDTGSAIANTMKFTFDTAINAFAGTIATTGAATWPTSTTGMWEAQVWMACVGSGTASTWYSSGQLTVGPGSAETGSAATYMFGNNIAAGIPQPLTIPTTTSYLLDIYSTWASAPTAMACSQFFVFGLN